MAKITTVKGVYSREDIVASFSSKNTKLNAQDIDQQLADQTYSFLRLVKPAGVNQSEAELAFDNLLMYLQKEVISKAKKPAFYIYKQTIEGKEKVGLLANSSVEDYYQDNIRKHEMTIAAKEEKIMEHLAKTKMTVSPVFLTYESRSGIDALLKQCMDELKCFRDFTSSKGYRHQVWQIDQLDIIYQFQELFEKEVQHLYIADGHHRAAASAKYAKEMMVENRNHTGEELYNYFFSVLIASNQLEIIDYNRVVKGLEGLSHEVLLERIETFFTIEKMDGAKRPEKEHEIAMYLGKQWYMLYPKEEAFNHDSPISSLDVTILQENLLSAILHIHDARNSERIHYVAGTKGIEAISKEVDEGEGDVGFVMYPVGIQQFFDIADSGHIMPPKSTWFEPKIRTGVIMSSIDE